MRARQPFEEHGAFFISEQADEAQFSARRTIEHYVAVPGEDRGDELVAELARITLDRDAFVFEDDVFRARAVAGYFPLGVGAAGFDPRAVVLGINGNGGKRRNHGHQESRHRYCPEDCARARIRPYRLSVNGARTPALRAISSVPARRPSISSGLPASMSWSIEVLKRPSARAMSMRASGTMLAS